MAGFPAKKNTAFTFWTALTSQADTKLLKENPTLAAGDVKVSIDGGAFADLGTLPDAEPDASANIRVQLTADEMNGNMIAVQFVDAAGAEWCSQMVYIQTDVATIGEIEALVDDIGEAGAGLTAIPTIANVDTVASTTTIGATGLAAIAAAVWNALTSGLTAAGSIGAHLLAKLGLITSGTVSVSSPVASGKNVTTIQGDDYDAADGRAIEWTVASTATLTGGTVAVIVEGVDTYTGSVVDETTIRLELTAAQTAAIPVGPHRYQVIVTQSVALGEDVLTLVEGTWTSARRYTK